MTNNYTDQSCKPYRSAAALILRKSFCPAALVLIFIILILSGVPDDSVFGSHVDWMSQHTALAETIRNACLEQGTLIPSWLELGGGSNGFMFSYYGFLRPDILIGCLLPRIPMIKILTAYMLCTYLASVLLFYCFLRAEKITEPFAFAGSILFMTAGCLFHMHRQIMFVNYLPFLILVFLCIRTQRIKWLPLCLCMIWLHSFYYIIAVVIAVWWYWFNKEGRKFWKLYFPKFICAVVISAAMAAALLIPAGLVILEHKRGGSVPSLPELLGPNVSFNNLLFNEYGMGLSFICLYAILAGLGRRKLRQGSIFFLLISLFGIFSYLLNGTLYARPKILIPFMPLVILHCVRFFQDEIRRTRCEAGMTDRFSRSLPLRGFRETAFPRWPFALIIPTGLLWFSQPQFRFILLDMFLLLCFCLLHKEIFSPESGRHVRIISYLAALLMTMTAPIGLYLVTARTEEWVSASEVSERLKKSSDSLSSADKNFRYDSLADPLESSNELSPSGQSKSSMYSSVTNRVYSEFYYNTLMTPVRINNRVALLPSDNPFLLNLMGIRYLETTRDHIPWGYDILYENDASVIAENKDVLPVVYFTDAVLFRQDYETLNPYEKLDALSRFTLIESSGSDPDSTVSAGSSSPFQPVTEDWDPDIHLQDLPDGLSVREAAGGYEITADRSCTVRADLANPVSGKTALLCFEVDNLTSGAVVIDINGIRNKLSGRYAPYPNGNECFHYQFSPGDRGDIRQLEITFSKGHYILREFDWHLYDLSLLQTKSYTPLETSEDSGSAAATGSLISGTPVRSGTIRTDTAGYLCTSIPVQNGLTILVDGKPSEPVIVNEAFAGTFIEAGTHTVEIRFSPPGKAAGCILSILTAGGYAIFLIGSAMKHRKKD